MNGMCMLITSAKFISSSSFWSATLGSFDARKSFSFVSVLWQFESITLSTYIWWLQTKNDKQNWSTVLRQLVAQKPTLIAPSACTEMQNFLSAFCKKICIIKIAIYKDKNWYIFLRLLMWLTLLQWKLDNRTSHSQFSKKKSHSQKYKLFMDRKLKISKF